MAVVVLDYTEFRTMFPVFSDLIKYPDVILDMYFTMATEYINNTDCSIVSDISKRKQLLYLTMAHLLTLIAGDKDGSQVGRVSSATQGSVSVTLEYKGSPNGTWWDQTQYGAMVWEMTKKYRSFRSITVECQPYNFWYGRFW